MKETGQNSDLRGKIRRWRGWKIISMKRAVNPALRPPKYRSNFPKGDSELFMSILRRDIQGGRHAVTNLGSTSRGRVGEAWPPPLNNSGGAPSLTFRLVRKKKVRRRNSLLISKRRKRERKGCYYIIISSLT